MSYKPTYAKGQILVYFWDDFGDEFVQIFGEGLGYELSGEEFEFGDAYIFKTKVGEEDRAAKHFMKYYRFVESAVRRDIKMEARWNKLEKIISKLSDLQDEVNIPDKLYISRLKAIREMLKVKTK